MNKKDIMDMSSGFEIDALVAQKIMGWLPHRWEHEALVGILWSPVEGKMRLIPNSPAEKRRRQSFGNTLADESPSFIFSPSTRINNAWDVLDKIRGTDAEIKFLCEILFWGAYSNMYEHVSAREEEALRICKAVLVAVIG